MILYEKFKTLNIDFAAIGLEQGDTEGGYFCTPEGAQVIGWAGVDGIHYCFVKGYGETVFAVSPMNGPGEYVHPIARSFEDLLRLLLACGSMDALEQAHQWDEGQFDTYVRDNQPGPKQAAVLEALRDTFDLVPMEGAFAYIKELQRAFDISQLKFSPEYYEMLPEPEAAPEVPEWKVTFEGGFRPRSGRAGKELAVDKVFAWGDEIWHIPAVYACGGGLVVDFCVEVAPERVKAFIDKWELWQEDALSFTPEEQELLRTEHPLNVDFSPEVQLNGKTLRSSQGYGEVWIPASCLRGENRSELKAKWLLERYGLDPSRGWAIRRCSFPWATKRAPAIKSLVLYMKRDPVSIPGGRFQVSKPGDQVSVVHPVTGEEHTLTVQEYQVQRMDMQHLQGEGMEYPDHCTVMSFTLSPELSRRSFVVQDCGQGDSPRRTKAGLNTNASASSMGVIGIIGSVDGPISVLCGQRNDAVVHTACSALYFESEEEIQWRITFREKTMQDVRAVLIEGK